MKRIALLVISGLFLLACQRDGDIHDTPVEASRLPEILNQDLAVVLETKHYVVSTPAETLIAHLQQWVRENPSITEDKALLEAVQQAGDNQTQTLGFTSIRADSVAKAKNLEHRLAYRISDLLRAKECLFYNKQRKMIESSCREFSVSSPMGYDGHGFIVSKDTILEVVDRIY